MDRIKPVHPAVLISFFFLLLTLAFAHLPYTPTALFDLKIYTQAGRDILSAEGLYGSTSRYFNPPWVAAFFIPLSFIPLNYAQGILSASSFIILLYILHKWQVQPTKVLFCVISPPMMSLLYYGQIDILVLGAVLFSSRWYLLAAITKLQVAAGLILNIRRKEWVPALGIGAAFLSLSFLVSGLWPLSLIGQWSPVTTTWNLWRNIYPWPVLIGGVLIGLAYYFDEPRLNLAASPFFLPYTAIHSLIGTWIVACALLSTRKTFLLWAAFWLAVIYRGFQIQ